MYVGPCGRMVAAAGILENSRVLLTNVYALNVDDPGFYVDCVPL